jgi:hypothetical protein
MSKRQLGILFIGVGVLAILGMFGMDLVGAGQFNGIGPAQQKGMMVSAVVIVLGLTLVPLGDKPA